MPNPQWPVSLPTRPIATGYVEGVGASMIRTRMEVGPPKRRRRTTISIKPYEWTYRLTTTQVDTLLTFYESTLGGGVLKFDIPHGRTGLTTTVAFREEEGIRLTPVSGGIYYNATLFLESVP